MVIVPGATLKAARIGTGPSSSSVTSQSVTSKGAGTAKATATATATATSAGGDGGEPGEPRPVSRSSSPSPERKPYKQPQTASGRSSSSSSSSPTPAPLGVGVALGVRGWKEDSAGKKNGKFSNAESKAVVDAVTEYAAANSVSVEQLCREGGSRGPFKGAWPTIANCLPERTIQSIFRHGVRKLNGLKSGPWSTAEVETLQSLVTKHGQKWTSIAKEMGRTADACRDKFREIIAPGTREGAWTAQEEDALNGVMMARLNLEGESPLTLTGEEKALNVQWAEVAKVVETRSRIACHLKWDYLQTQRRIKRQHLVGSTGGKGHSKTSNANASINVAFVKALVSTGASDESEVDWTSLSSTYPRAPVRWRTLRGCRKKQSPYSHLGFQEAARAIIADLQERVASAAENDSSNSKNTNTNTNTRPQGTSTSISTSSNPPGQSSTSTSSSSSSSSHRGVRLPQQHEQVNAKRPKKNGLDCAAPSPASVSVTAVPASRAGNAHGAGASAGPVEESGEGGQEKLSGGNEEGLRGLQEDGQAKDKPKEKKKKKKKKKRARQEEEEEESEPRDKEETKKKKKIGKGQEEEGEGKDEEERNIKRKREREGQEDESEGINESDRNKVKKKEGQKGKKKTGEVQEGEGEGKDEEERNKKRKREREGQEGKSEGGNEADKNKVKKKRKKKKKKTGAGTELLRT